MKRALFLALLAACTVDRDGDGIPADRDCNDDNKQFNPRADDPVGDGYDTNCDGVDGVDADGDGEPSAASGGFDCADDDATTLGPDEDGDGFAACLDCDDDDRLALPGGEEVCDGIDNDCDGGTDLDEDGVGMCTAERAADGLVDFLFVVDTSGSMVEEQPQIASTSSILIPGLLAGTADFHVGVVSMDMFDSSHSGKLRQAGGVRWIEPTTPNPEQVFVSMIEMGTTGSASANGLDATYAALEVHAGPGGYNEGFLREDAELAIVVISDGTDTNSSVGVTELRDYLSTLKWSSDHVRLHAFIAQSGDGCADFHAYGDDYAWLTIEIGGLVHPICDPDWTAPLTQIIGDFGVDVTQEFGLGVVANPDSLYAIVETDPYPPHLEYSADQLTLVDGGSTVRLPEPAPSGAWVRIFYAPL